MKYTDTLMKSLVINGIEIKNRVLMPAMDTNYGDANGFVSERMHAHYVERAKGGAGLIVTEALSVSAPEGRISAFQVHINEERSISKFLYLTDCVHSHGAKILAQLHHGGYKASPLFNNGIVPVTASGDAGFGGRSLSISEIKKIQADFIHSAEIALKAGFDGIELHGAHAYLINQFFSTASNKRTDAYGGSSENRFRFLDEIIRGIKEVAPRKFIVGVRLGFFEYGKNALTLEEAVQIAKKCEESGVDILNLSVGHIVKANQSTLSQWDDNQHRIDGAEKVKAVVKIPVSVVGKFRDPEQCAKMIADGKSDFVTIGRQLLCDPYWPQKVMTGNEDKIRNCLNCNEGCFYRLLTLGGDVRCVLNPYVGFDHKYSEHSPIPSSRKKKIAVIGAGPAGMQFAITASRRGHDVTLFEKDNKLGGQMNLAAMTPFKEDMQKALYWFTSEVERSSVKIMLNTEANANTIIAGNFEHAVISCGSVPTIPPIKGIDRAIDFKSFLEQGKNALPSGKNVVIIGGGTVGCEIAHLLIELGCKVTVLEMLQNFCNGMEVMHKGLLLNALNEKATMESSVLVKEITESGVIYTRKDGSEVVCSAEIVVCSTGQRPLGRELEQELAANGIVTHRLGESISTPGNIRTATRGALDLAYAV